MVKIDISIESATAEEAAADLRRLAQIVGTPACSVSVDAAVEPAAEAPAQAPVESAPATAKKTRTKKAPEPTAPAAPVTPAPVAPVVPAAPVAPAVPVQAPVASVPTPEPAAAPAPTPAPMAAAEPAITLEALSRAGSGLVMAGKMPDVMGLLNQFGVQAITQLKKDQYPAFAAGLRALGASI